MARKPDARALPFLLAANETKDWGANYSLARALTAQDDPRAANRLLELANGASNPHQARLWVNSRREQLWRTGATTEAGLCKPHGEQPLAALATPAADGTIGTAHPFLFQEVAPDGSWTVLCQAREDTDHDGKISVMLGHHGDALGDEMRPFLVVGSGRGAGFDEILASDATGRFVAARAGACLSLVDTRKKTEVVFANADLRDDDAVFGAARGAAFDRRGEHLPYLRGGPKRRVPGGADPGDQRRGRDRSGGRDALARAGAGGARSTSHPRRLRRPARRQQRRLTAAPVVEHVACPDVSRSLSLLRLRATCLRRRR
jgi:hypothetical protein